MSTVKGNRRLPFTAVTRQNPLLASQSKEAAVSKQTGIKQVQATLSRQSQATLSRQLQKTAKNQRTETSGTSPPAKRRHVESAVEMPPTVTQRKRRSSLNQTSTGDIKKALDFLPVIDETLFSQWGQVKACKESKHDQIKESNDDQVKACEEPKHNELDSVEIPDKKSNKLVEEQQDELAAGDSTAMPSMQDALILSPRTKNRPPNVHRTPVNTPTRSTADQSPALKGLPAHLKYQSLVQRHQPASALALPPTHQRLAKMFEGLESVCAFYRGRHEENLLHFHRIQRAVANYCDHDFQLKHLAQIVTVYPGAYELSRCTTTINGQKRSSFLITVVNNQQQLNQAGGVSVGIQMAKLNQLRKREFNRLLLERVYAAHCQFLRKLQLPVLALDQLKQWHPDFQLDSVPEVEEAEAVLQLMSYDGDANKRLQELITIRPVEKAPIAMPAVQNENENVSNQGQQPPKDPSKMTVLERVRWKQQQKALQQMKKLTKEQSAELLALNRLEELVDRLDFHYSSYKKNAFYINELVKSLMGSMKVPLSEMELRELMMVLSRTIPEWCMIVKSEFGTLVRLNRSAMTLKDVHVKLSQAIEKLQSP